MSDFSNPKTGEKVEEKCIQCGHRGLVYHINGVPGRDKNICFGRIRRNKISEKHIEYFCEKCAEDILGDNEFVEVRCDRCLKKGVVLTRGKIITPKKGIPARFPDKH